MAWASSTLSDLDLSERLVGSSLKPVWRWNLFLIEVFSNSGRVDIVDVSLWRSCTHRVGVKVEANPTLPGQPYRRQQTGYISSANIKALGSTKCCWCCSQWGQWLQGDLRKEQSLPQQPVFLFSCLCKWKCWVSSPTQLPLHFPVVGIAWLWVNSTSSYSGIIFSFSQISFLRSHAEL